MRAETARMIVILGEINMKDKNEKTKLDILNQSRDRTPMPRPATFRDKKKYDRNTRKLEDRKEEEEKDR